MCPRASFGCCFAATIKRVLCFEFLEPKVQYMESFHSGVPVDVKIAGCLVKALGCNQCCCPLGTSTKAQSCPVLQRKALSYTSNLRKVMVFLKKLYVP